MRSTFSFVCMILRLFFLLLTPISITQAAGQMFIIGLRPHLSEDEYVKFRAGLDEAQIKIVANKKTMEDFHAERDFEETGEGFGSRSLKERQTSFLLRRHSSLFMLGVSNISGKKLLLLLEVLNIGLW